jgi:hypothetical protein
MKQRVQVENCPVSIDGTYSERGFHGEILPLSEVGSDFQQALLQRALNWSRFVSAELANAPVRCFPEGNAIVIDSPEAAVSSAQLALLGCYLRSELTHSEPGPAKPERTK